MKKYLNAKFIIIAGVVVLSIGLFINSRLANAGPGHDENTVEGVNETESVVTIPVETVAAENSTGLKTSNPSWPGEVLSIADVQIHPLRDGQIAEWRVRLGDYVRQGQVLGRLSAAPMAPELLSLLAERQQAIIQARANTEGTKQFIITSKQQLAELKIALDKSRDAAVQAAETNMQALVGTGSVLGTDNTNPGLLNLKRDKIRSVAEGILQKYVNKLSIHYGTNTFITLRPGLGVSDSNSQTHFNDAAETLKADLLKQEVLPEKGTLAFLAATQRLLLKSIATEQGYGLSEEELSELRIEVSEDQTVFLDALNEYNEAGITIASSNGTKNTAIAEAGAAYAEKKAELDGKIAELDRELLIAQAEVQAAETAYGAVAAGLPSQNIVAPRSGVLSAVYKNLGDHVAPDIAIAGISSAQAKGKFIRFRIPGDARTPEAGEQITVERPGFPLSPKKARVIGVGLALDSNGSYVADAEFTEEVNWPVHASVRIITETKAPLTFIPLAAVWWNEKGEANVWLVMENNIIRPRIVRIGRAVGDRVEVEEGLVAGERYVMNALSNLKTGQSITELNPVKQEVKEEPAGDGHGHSHDE